MFFVIGKDHRPRKTMMRRDQMKTERTQGRRQMVERLLVDGIENRSELVAVGAVADFQQPRIAAGGELGEGWMVFRIPREPRIAGETLPDRPRLAAIMKAGGRHQHIMQRFGQPQAPGYLIGPI